jgi:hypothetical protein
MVCLRNILITTLHKGDSIFNYNNNNNNVLIDVAISGDRDSNMIKKEA